MKKDRSKFHRVSLYMTLWTLTFKVSTTSIRKELEAYSLHNFFNFREAHVFKIVTVFVLI